MAFNWRTFRERSLSAILFLAIMLTGLLWSRWSFFLLFTVIHFGAWREYLRIVQLITTHTATWLLKLGFPVAGWCLLMYFTNQELQVSGVFLSGIGWWLGMAMMLLLPLFVLVRFRASSLISMGYCFFGFFYISLPLALLIYLRNYWAEEDYRLNLVIPLLMVFTIWLNDTLAYLVGSMIGKTPLSPVSPKKTWEGTIGGIVLSVVIMCLAAYYTQHLQLIHTAAIALSSSVFGSVGDLFQSKLKRMAGVKDSGSILPGHGGFLDRFDSLLFASVVVWFYVAIIMK